MRKLIILACLLSSPAMAQVGNHIDGPATFDVMGYLTNTMSGCDDGMAKNCSLLSRMIGAETHYGEFPDDPGKYVVTFLTLTTGGSGAEMRAIVMKNVNGVHYNAVGDAVVWGGFPKDVQFNRNRTISWIGTVMGPNDPHCCPTAHQAQHLSVGAPTGLRFHGARAI